MNPKKKQVILLNGPSSSGKSTLAIALQSLIASRCGGRYGVVSIDDYLEFSPGEPVYENDVFAVSGLLCREVQASLRTMSGVIVDHVVTSERIYAQFLDAVAPFGLLTVRLTCPPDILNAREKERGNRCPGSSEASLRYLYPQDGYDLTVDTGMLQPEEAAARVWEACSVL